jgi:hypothetical protein
MYVSFNATDRCQQETREKAILNQVQWLQSERESLPLQKRVNSYTKHHGIINDECTDLSIYLKRGLLWHTIQ